MFNVTDLTKKYGKTTVVDNVQFSLAENRCITLLGPNGAGKTTVLRMLTGLTKATTGKIEFNKQNNTDLRSFIGYLPQHPVFYPWMTGMQYLMHCAKIHNIEKQTAKSRASDLLEKVGLTDANDKQIGNYSGGMKQRLGIAQAIIHKPQLLLLDEPVSALDPIGRRDVLTLMEDLKKEMTILFSTHILNDADEISDELILLHEGKVIEAGEINKLRKKYQTTMIELTFAASVAEDYKQVLAKLSSVIDISIVGEKFHLTVTDIALAREEILQKSLAENWDLHSFTINRASLEDMFMKAVQSCNG